MAWIKLENLSVEFDDHFVLQSIDWQIDRDSHWALLGPNGAGKSALTATLIDAGKILEGRIKREPTRIAVVSFEAQAELIEAERRKDDADLLDVISEGTPVQEILDEQCRDRALQEQLVEALSIGHLLSRSFRKLSSGETRKTLLIRAMCSRPELLILDDPFEGLDANSFTQLKELLDQYAEHTPILMVLNRFDEIPHFITHIGYLSNGHLEHCVDKSDQERLDNLAQLMHLRTTELRIPRADLNPKRPAMEPGEPLVRLEDAKVAYSDNVVFEHLNWTIEPGEHWQVTGPNGSGKTCLLNLITGDHPQCYVNNIRVFGMQRGSGESIWDIKQFIGYVSSALQWEYKVSVSVRNAIISGFYDSIGIYQKYTENQKNIADDWLRLLGLEAVADRPFNQLSFGDQRLILIARAMVKHPPLLILDEPCLGLDDLNRQLVLALIEKICEGAETTVLYVNHRPQDKIAGIDKHLALGSFD